MVINNDLLIFLLLLLLLCIILIAFHTFYLALSLVQRPHSFQYATRTLRESRDKAIWYSQPWIFIPLLLCYSDHLLKCFLFIMLIWVAIVIIVVFLIQQSACAQVALGLQNEPHPPLDNVTWSSILKVGSWSISIFLSTFWFHMIVSQRYIN